MTSDKYLKEQMNRVKADLLQIVNTAALTEGLLERIIKSMDTDEDLRSRLVFKYDLSGEADNQTIDGIKSFMEKNTPEGFEPSQRQMFFMAKIARMIEPESKFIRPEYSWDTFNKIMQLAFQLGYISGWKNKRTKRQKKAQ